MLYLLCALIAIDAVLTLVGLHDGHTEQFAPMKWLIERLGAPAALICTHAGSIAMVLIWTPSKGWLIGLSAFFLVLATTNLYRLMKPPTTP